MSTEQFSESDLMMSPEQAFVRQVAKLGYGNALVGVLEDIARAPSRVSSSTVRYWLKKAADHIRYLEPQLALTEEERCQVKT